MLVDHHRVRTCPRGGDAQWVHLHLSLYAGDCALGGNTPQIQGGSQDELAQPQSAREAPSALSLTPCTALLEDCALARVLVSA